MNLKSLNERKAEIKNEIKGLASIENRSLNAEEVAKSDNLLHELTAIDKQIELVERSSNFDANVEEATTNFAKDERSAFFAYVSGNNTAEVRSQLQKTDNKGGFAVPTTMADKISEQLAYYCPMMNYAQVLQTEDTGAFEMPTINETSVVAAFGTEASALSATDVTFGQKTVGAERLATLIQLSEEFLMSNGVDFVENYVSGVIADRMGRALAEKLTNGTGTNEPEGFANGLVAAVTAASASAITREEIINLIHSVDVAYRNNPNFVMMMNDSTVAYLRTVTLGTGDARPLFQENAVDGFAGKIEGVNIVINNNLPAIGTGVQPIVVGDFSQFLVRQGGGYNVRRLNERYADNFLVGIQGYSWFDSVVLQPAAFASLEMA